MRTIQVPEAAFASEAACHEALARAAGFPGYYGKNWDALIDCLSDVEEPLEIQVVVKDGNKYFKSPAWAMFAACAAAVNGRLAASGSAARVVISEKTEKA